MNLSNATQLKELKLNGSTLNVLELADGSSVELLYLNDLSTLTMSNLNRLNDIKYSDYEDNTTPDEPAEADSYTVQAGDNLWQIVARRYQLDDNAEIYRKEIEIAALNGIDNPGLIYAGMVINFN